MKQTKYLLLILFLAVACGDPIQPEPAPTPTPQPQPTVTLPTFQASFVGMEANPTMGWKEGARISVFNKTNTNLEYKFKGKEGDKTGEFEAVTTSAAAGSAISHVYAVCPYSGLHYIGQNGTLKVYFPAVLSNATGQLGEAGCTMVAVSDNTSLVFKSITGFLKVRLSGENLSVKELTLEGNNGEILSGVANVSFAPDGSITTTMDATDASSIKLSLSQAIPIGTKADNSTEFVFAIPPTTFEKGITVTGKDAAGNIFTVASSEPITVESSQSAATKRVMEVDRSVVTIEDPVFKELLVERYDRNHDGEISAEEALNVTTISIDTQNISSLKGIERFVNLRHPTPSLELLFVELSVLLESHSVDCSFALQYLFVLLSDVVVLFLEIVRQKALCRFWMMSVDNVLAVVGDGAVYRRGDGRQHPLLLRWRTALEDAVVAAAQAARLIVREVSILWRDEHVALHALTEQPVNQRVHVVSP